MIAALGAALTVARSKAFEWAATAAAIVLGVLGFVVLERRAGAASVRAEDTARELGDRRTADAIAERTAREPDPKAALDREFGR